jgi:hypothetical protein
MGKGSDRRNMDKRYCTLNKFNENWSKAFPPKEKFQRGDKVIYIPENKIYDFAYIGGEGHAIIYEEGCCNMQDASAVDLDKIKKVEVQNAKES